MKFFIATIFSLFLSANYSFGSSDCDVIGSSEGGELLYCEQAQYVEFSPFNGSVEDNLIIEDVASFVGIAVYNDNIALRYNTSSLTSDDITVVYCFSENKIVFSSLDPESYGDLNELEKFMLKQLEK
ncbi:MAG: hypothetical protein H6621_12565 [Halobacteriovoraceae bacterium]|nr:hypothetical protein [Halobacteriovoraceae bacterium]